MGAERRRFPRIPQLFEVHYRVGEVGAGWDAATTVNLSAAGLRLRSEHPIDPDSRIELRIQLPNAAEPLQLMGLVVWSQPLSPLVTEVGVEFIDVTLEQQTQIDHLVQFLSKRVQDA